MDQQPPVIGLVGLGTMGIGILQRAVEKGVTVIALTRDASREDKIRKQLERSCKMSIRLKRAEKDAVEQAMQTLSVTDAVENLAPCSLIIECVKENFPVKVETLSRLAGAFPSVTLASNTSSYSIAKLANESGAANRLIGLHFMNPVPNSQLVELVVPVGTEERHAQAGQLVADSLGLTAIRIGDTPGFAVNRCLMPMIAEAARLLQSGGAEAQEIDTAMRLGCGHAMGPLALADMIGLDIILSELQTLADELGPRFDPPENLVKLVKEDKLGRKSGEGFFSYGG